MRQLIAFSSVILLVACAEKPTAADAQPLPVPPAAPVVTTNAASTDMPDIQPAQSFDQWLANFRVQALNAGISPTIFDNAFNGVTPDMSVIKADRSQPEFSRPVWEYLDGALSPLRVRNGQRLLEQNAELLSRIEQRYGVDRQALVSVWGMESNFGTQGNQGFDQYGSLDGHVDAAQNLRALERLFCCITAAQTHQGWHFGLGDERFATAPLGEGHISDFIVGKTCRRVYSAHQEPPFV